MFLVVLCVLVRFPYWFASVIDWDESTLILMGQELVDRKLAYVGLWDNKPPLAFVPFALAISVFGHSIVAVRAMGALFLAAAAFLVFRIGQEVESPALGLGAAILAVVFAGATDGGQATLTEILVLLPLLAATSSMMGRRLTAANAFWAGFFFAVAALVRSNLAIVSVVAWSIPLRQAWKERDPRPALAYAAGTAVPLLAIGVRYLWAGHLDTLVQAAVIAPLRFSTSQLTVTDALTSQAAQALDSPAFLLWIGLCLGVVAVWSGWDRSDPEQRTRVARLGLVLAAVLISVGASGADHAHYMIQAVPLAALFAAVAFRTPLSGSWRAARRILVAAGFLIALFPVVQRGVVLVVDVLRHGSPFSDSGYRISRHIDAGNQNDEPVLLLTDHIGYWLTESRPPGTIIAHPSNLARPYFLDGIVGPGTTPHAHLATILARSPRYVVTMPDPWYLEGEPAAAELLDRTLATEYRLEAVIDGRQVYVLR